MAGVPVAGFGEQPHAVTDQQMAKGHPSGASSSVAPGNGGRTDRV